MDAKSLFASLTGYMEYCKSIHRLNCRPTGPLPHARGFSCNRQPTTTTTTTTTTIYTGTVNGSTGLSTGPSTTPTTATNLSWSRSSLLQGRPGRRRLQRTCTKRGKTDEKPASGPFGLLSPGKRKGESEW